jgi:sugar O-acyltransferase (sialic acid O-acetyltransferase NeuD family)
MQPRLIRPAARAFVPAAIPNSCLGERAPSRAAIISACGLRLVGAGTVGSGVWTKLFFHATLSAGEMPLDEPEDRVSEVIYGAGGHGRELAFQLREIGRPVVAFIDDFNSDRTEQQTPVLSYRDAARLHPQATWHVAIGNISVREALLAKLRSEGLHVGGILGKHTIIAPTAVIDPTAQIFGHNVISDSCRIANDVIVNFGCTISHDVHIGSGSIVCPKVAVAGNVRIGKKVWLGVGCTIINGSVEKPVFIGDGSYVGAGACVIRDVLPDAVVYGVPAKSTSQS